METFKMKYPPKKPKLNSYVEHILDINIHHNLQEIIDKIKEYCGEIDTDFSPNDLSFVKIGECHSDWGEIEIKINIPLDNKTSELKYIKELKEYKQWKIDNKEKINLFNKEKKRAKLQKQLETQLREAEILKQKLKDI